jgi:hypothetical protein
VKCVCRTAAPRARERRFSAVFVVSSSGEEVGLLACEPQNSWGLKIEATTGLGLAPTSNRGPEFFELHPAAAPCKNQHQKENTTETSWSRDRGSYRQHRHAIKPPRWPTPTPRSRCARASLSATLCSVASRWSCESSSQFPPCPRCRSARTPPIARMPRGELPHHRGHCDGSTSELTWAHAMETTDWTSRSANLW